MMQGIDCNDSKFVWETKVSSFLCDKNRELRLSAILNLQQEIGERHLITIGMSYKYMFDNLGLFFVITKLNSVIHRRPILEEALRITTWCKGLFGAQFYRCYRFETLSGELLIDSISSIATLSVANHCIIKPKDIPEFKKFNYCDQSSTCEKPLKIPFVVDLTTPFIRPVYFSDLDYNNHMNNAVYADIMCDCFPSTLSGKNITQFGINFLLEATPKSTLKIMISEKDVNTILFAAEHEKGKCFSAFCKTN